MLRRLIVLPDDISPHAHTIHTRSRTPNLHPTPFGHASAALASTLSQVFRSSHNFMTRVTWYSRASRRTNVASRKFGKFNPAQRARHHAECRLRAREAAPTAREAAGAVHVVRRLGAQAHLAPVAACAAFDVVRGSRSAVTSATRLVRRSNERQLDIGADRDARSRHVESRQTPSNHCRRSIKTARRSRSVPRKLTRLGGSDTEWATLPR